MAVCLAGSFALSSALATTGALFYALETTLLPAADSDGIAPAAQTEIALSVNLSIQPSAAMSSEGETIQLTGSLTDSGRSWPYSLHAATIFESDGVKIAAGTTYLNDSGLTEDLLSFSIHCDTRNDALYINVVRGAYGGDAPVTEYCFGTLGQDARRGQRSCRGTNAE